jgi:phage terminase small subunit
MSSLQDRFAATYVANGGNAAEAARVAGYKPGTMTTKLLASPTVQKKIAKYAENSARKFSLTVDLAAANIFREMTFDPARLFHPDGTVKKVHELDDDTRMALTSVEVDPDTGAVSYKWAAKSAARSDLMKHLGMFERDNSQKAESLSLLIKMV